LEVNRESLLFVEFNRGKRSSTIDARHPQGKALLRRLAAASDILIDNFSAGVIDRLGFGYEEMRRAKPDIIQITMPGMGRTGPLRSWYTWGPQLLGYTGLTYLWGYPEAPVASRAKIPFADFVSGAFASLAMLAALEHRDRTGEGQSIELAQMEGQAALLGPAILDYTINGREWQAMGYQEHLGAPYAPYGCYPCRGTDAWIVIACGTEAEWRGLVRVMGEPSWVTEPRFATKAGRRELWGELDQRLAEWTRGFTPRQAMRLLQGAGVPAGIPLSAEDVYHDLHLRARGHIVEIDQPHWGRLAFPGLPGLPSRSAAGAAGPTPWLGDDNDYVFGHLLGMSAAEIREQVEAGAIH
ncbi:MAG: CoA transferase, partial [Chloroflexi bacterium]|nr:CoA transferase [Chloroflexota bacterium]